MGAFVFDAFTRIADRRWLSGVSVRTALDFHRNDRRDCQAGLEAFAAAMVSRAMRLAVIAAVRAVLATSAVASAPSYKTMRASASDAVSATPVSAASARKESRTQRRYSLNRQLLGLARRRLGGGVDEGAAPELRKCHVVGDRVEHREDLLLRIVDAGLCCIHALAPCIQAASKVRGDEFVLAAEYVVQRALGHAGLFDNGVDAGGMHPVAVEQLIRGGKQPLPR